MATTLMKLNLNRPTEITESTCKRIPSVSSFQSISNLILCLFLESCLSFFVNQINFTLTAIQLKRLKLSRLMLKKKQIAGIAKESGGKSQKEVIY